MHVCLIGQAGLILVKTLDISDTQNWVISDYINVTALNRIGIRVPEVI